VLPSGCVSLFENSTNSVVEPEHLKRNPSDVITGYNTDIEHDGVVYHVQTEDKGTSTPIILSLVYSGGAILASKRSPYDDLISSGFDEAKLAERLKRQHRLICAAIHAGRVNELKRMTGDLKGVTGRLRDLTPPSLSEAPQVPDVPASAVSTLEGALPNETPVESAPEIVPQAPVEAPPEPVPQTPVEVPQYRSPPPLDELVFEFEMPAQSTEVYEPPSVESSEIELPQLDETGEPSPFADDSSPYSVYDARRHSVEADSSAEQTLRLAVLNEADEFTGGLLANVKCVVTRMIGDQERPLHHAAVSVKILGTAFRPIIHTAKTGKDGVVIFSLRMPKFSSGRAAILVRATVDDESAEVRRVIHPG